MPNSKSITATAGQFAARARKFLVSVAAAAGVALSEGLITDPTVARYVSTGLSILAAVGVYAARNRPAAGEGAA